jgi:hypothetical protein
MLLYFIVNRTFFFGYVKPVICENTPLMFMSGDQILRIPIPFMLQVITQLVSADTARPTSFSTCSDNGILCAKQVSCNLEHT